MNGTSQPVPPPPGVAPAKTGMSPLAWIGIGCVVIIICAGLALGVMGWLAKRAVDKFAKNPTMTAAELMVRANPDLELVSKDEKANSITVRDKKTGEVTTFSADDAKNGKFSVKTDKGSATFDASSGTGVNVKATDDKGQVTTFNAGANGNGGLAMKSTDAQGHVTTFNANSGGTPQNLPSWLPVYPGGTVQGTYDTTNNEGRSAAFTVATKDDSGKVLDYYEAQLRSAGLKPQKTTYNTTSTTGGAQTGGTVAAKSDDGKREASVIVSANAQGTQAVVTFQEKK
jgi:hypothetical protein